MQEVYAVATIKDVARLTGVSAATVSNVLNGKRGAASEAKVQEIFRVAQELHYRPNSLAKNLKLQRSNTIGIITEDLTVFNTPEIVNGIEEYCEEQGYEILLANMRLFKRYNNNLTDTPEHAVLFENTTRNLMAKQVEGIVYIGYHCRPIAYLPPDHIPFVYAYCFPKSPLYPYVLFDDEKAGYQVSKALIEHGHRSIGLISGPLASLNAQARLRGAQKALYEAGILYNASTTLYGDWNRESGYQCAEKLLDMGVTAIFAFNDMMASGVYACCIDRGIAVGRDIALFGYDNLNIVEAYVPPISSVEPPLREMGYKSAELILAQIRSREPLPTMAHSLDCTVYVRGSVCAAPPAAD